MKMLRAAVALAFLLICAPAFAQWQTPNHSVPLGRGAGVTGFGSAAPGTTGMPFVSQGASSDPAFGTIGNSGFAAGAADTYKGSLDGTTVVDVPRAPCTAVNQALRYTAGVGESCGNVTIQTGYDMPVNLGLSVPAPSGGALVINLTQANGSAPSSTNPVLVPFRSTALTTGTVTWSTISATQSITIPSGATLGTSSGVPSRVWIFEDYNGGSPELGVATCSNSTTIFPCSSWETTLKTSTTISGSSNTAGVPYATAGVISDAIRIIGYCEFANGQTTAGTWASSCTTLQVFGPGVKKPGDIVQTVYAQSASTATATISPTSTVNLVSVTMNATCSAALNANATGQIKRGSTSIGQSNPCVYLGGGTSSGYESSIGANVLDAPGTTSSTAYTINNGGATSISNQMLTVYEIMGKLDRKPVNDNINPGLYSRIG